MKQYIFDPKHRFRFYKARMNRFEYVTILLQFSDIIMSTHMKDETQEKPQDTQENTPNGIGQYTEKEIEDMRIKFQEFDDDGGGGLTAPELEKCKY